ncbi:MAG: dethiobiotin synthase [Acidimicrobiia bacterium]
MSDPTRRPALLVLVTGTATEIGKTWFGAATAAELRGAGVQVARKPVQSGEPGPPSDADLLAAAPGEPVDRVCPPHRTYPVAWAPPMAADELGLPPFTVADLAAEITWDDGTDLGMVEGVGGPRSPIASDGDSVDLARILDPDLVVLVADAGLGTINAVRLSASAFAGKPVVVALNRFGDDSAAAGLHARNLEHLTVVDRFDVVTSPAALAEHLHRQLADRP